MSGEQTTESTNTDTSNDIAVQSVPSVVPEISIESILGLMMPTATQATAKEAVKFPSQTPPTRSEDNKQDSLFFVDDSTRNKEPERHSQDGIDITGLSQINAYGSSKPYESTYDAHEPSKNVSSDAALDFLSKLQDRKDPSEEDRQYQLFLQRESEQASRGDWDRFPAGSRMFIATDTVTKLDVFKMFSKYGDLAQISLKQAYGFVQFLKTEDCARAIEGEQGAIVEGRKIHLEESKPQGSKRDRNERNQRRSVSPGRGSRQSRNSRSSAQSRGGTYGGYLGRQEEDEHGRDRGYRRDSPPPRGRDRGYRERSPYGSRYRRSPSPPEEWPLPTRRPEETPECQILVTDRVERNFVYYVQKAFEDRYIKVNVLDISPRISMSSIIRQMVIEGVFAVVVLNTGLQNQAKLSLQVFEKTNGSSTVRFDEYMSVDIPIGAEIVLRTKQKLQPQPALQAPPANALQYLLGALAQQQQNPQVYPGQQSMSSHPYGLN